MLYPTLLFCIRRRIGVGGRRAVHAGRCGIGHGPGACCCRRSIDVVFVVVVVVGFGGKE